MSIGWRRSATSSIGSDFQKKRMQLMTIWAKDELGKIAATHDLHIAPLREDGKTYGTPTWIWSVVVDGALYVRAYRGKASRWYLAAMRQRAGRITAAGLTKEVS